MRKEVIKLGMEVKDRISGFQGIVTSITEFIYGCRRLGVAPQMLTGEGKPRDEYVIDEPQLDIVGNGIRDESFPREAVKRKRNYGDPNFVPIKHQPDLRK